MTRHAPRSRRRVPLPDGIEHGTVWAYDYYRCGCGPCRDAKTTKAARTRARRRQRQELFPDVPKIEPKLRLPEWLTPELFARIQAGPREDWCDEARCRPGADEGRPDWAKGLDPDDFYNDEPDQQDIPDVRVQGWCELCPVRADCIADALRYETQSMRNGWWGSSPSDRRQIQTAINRGHVIADPERQEAM